MFQLILLRDFCIRAPKTLIVFSHEIDCNKSFRSGDVIVVYLVVGDWFEVDITPEE